MEIVAIVLIFGFVAYKMFGDKIFAYFDKGEK